MFQVTVPVHVLARPPVALVAAATALDVGDVAAADRCLQRMENSAPLRTDRIRALHATVAVHRARLGGDLATLATTSAGHTGDADLDLLALVNRGPAAIWLGEYQAAETDLKQALQLAMAGHRDSVTLHCLIHLAAIAAANCDLVRMSIRASRAIDFATTRDWTHTSRCAFAYVMVAVDAYQRGEHDNARRFSSQAVALLAGQTDPTVELSAFSLDAMVAFDTADDPHALVATLRQHWRRLAGQQLAPFLTAYVAPIEQRMALHVGEHGWAAEVVERVHDLLGPCGEHHLLRAVLHTHRGRPNAARRLLQPVLDGQAPSIVTNTIIDAWLLEALLLDRAGDQRRAHEALSRALAAAEPRQALRPFLDAGRPVRDLLAREAGRFGRLETFATKAMTSLPSSSVGVTNVLTTRELDLLVELPSMRTAEEIADSLFVSVNTVKTHLRGIYRKLGVNHRRDAITVARQLGLL